MTAVRNRADSRGRLLLAAVLLPWIAGAANGETGPEEGAESPFAPTPEIEALGRRLAAGHRIPGQRLDALVDLIFDDRKGLGFQYARRPTLTAAEALERRSGNCLSLVNLFVALARSAELPARFVEVTDFEAFYRDQAAIVRSTHVIGGVPLDGQMVTVDFLPGRPKTYRRLEPIDDRRAAAHFYNAVGAEAMLEGRVDRADGLFRRALELDPGHAETWNNRGVLAWREGGLEAAIELLENALAHDRELLAAMENLAGLYRVRGRPDLAARMGARALKLRTGNPYFLLQQAFQRLDQGRPAEAGKLLRRARRQDPTIPEVYVGLGRVEMQRGRQKKASLHFEEAKRRSAAYSERFQGRLQSKIDRLTREREGGEPDGAGKGAAGP